MNTCFAYGKQKISYRISFHKSHIKVKTGFAKILLARVRDKWQILQPLVSIGYKLRRDISREEEVITRQGLKKIGLNWRVFLLLCSWMKEEFLVITVALFDSFSRFW